MPAADPLSGAISKVLADLADAATADRVRLSDLVAALGGRTFSLLILVFALPNAVGLGTIPGVSTIFGLPQLVVALQMAIGLERPWLPARLLERSIAREDFLRIVAAATPYILKVERLLRERPFPLFQMFERLLALILAALALIQALPIPFGNQPPAAAAAILAIGMIGRDWVVVVVGLVAAVLAVALALGVVVGGAEAALLLARHLFN